MSALDELKKKNPLDMTMLEFVITQAEYSEISGNAEEAAAELLALRERVAKLELAIINALNPGEPKALEILEAALKSQ